MKRSLSALMIALTSGAGLACASNKIVPQPSSITFEAALLSVANGLREMKRAEGDTRTGLLAAEVEVTFNVTASGTDNGKLVVDVGAMPVEAVKGSAEAGSTITSARGNQIHIKFTNLLYAENSQLVFAKPPDEVAKILDVLVRKDVTFKPQ